MQARNLSIQKKTAGFTLFEVVISLFILAMLSSAIALISKTSLGLSVTLLEEQQRQLHNIEVIDHIDQHFLDFTSESRISLVIDETNNNVQTLTITRPNHYFPFEGRDTLADETSFTGVFNENTLLDIVQLSYPSGQESTSFNPQNREFKQTTLLTDLNSLAWEFYDERAAEWVQEWNVSQGVPRRIKLTYRHIDEQTESVKVFWLQPTFSTS